MKDTILILILVCDSCEYNIDAVMTICRIQRDNQHRRVEVVIMLPWNRNIGPHLIKVCHSIV